MAREAFGDDVVDHYLNYARTEQGLFDRSSPATSASGCSSADEAGHRHHLVRRGGHLGRLGLEPRRSCRSLRSRGGARGRTAARRPAERGLDRGDARRCSTGSSSPAAPTSTRRSTAPSRIRRRTRRARSATGPRWRCCAAALERDMPVLAVCRGSQVLNVALGGDLVQHLPDSLGHEGHKLMPGAFVGARREARGRRAASGTCSASTRP